MAKEILAVPEGKLFEVIAVIRAGLRCKDKDEQVSDETREQLSEWCDDEEEYLRLMEVLPRILGDINSL